MRNYLVKKKVAVLIVLAILFVVSACDSGDDFVGDTTPTTYELSFEYLGEGELPELDGEYEDGATADLMADGDNGWRFYKWEGEGIQDPYEKETSLLVESDQTVRAIFIEEYEGDANEDGYAGWEGTEEKPYMIKNYTQLNNVREDLGANYILIEDIDLNPDENGDWDPIGDYWYDQKEERWLFIGFSGLFDGRDYSINNLEYSYDDNDEISLKAGIGFFAVIDGAEVIDINLLDVDVNAIVHSGGLAGLIENESVVKGCYVEGNLLVDYSVGGITGTNNGGKIVDSFTDVDIISSGIDFDSILSNAGGIVGSNSAGEVYDSRSYGDITAEGMNAGGLVGQNSSNGVINGCYAMGDTFALRHTGGLVGINKGLIEESFATGDVEGKGHLEHNSADAGGLVGAVYDDGLILNSYAVGNVTSQGNNVGGLAGQIHGTIMYSYAVGKVNGEDIVGGLVGSFHDPENPEIVSSYYDTETTGQDDEGNGEPKSTEEMKRKATFENWDFDEIWDIDEGSSYPYFK